VIKSHIIASITIEMNKQSMNKQSINKEAINKEAMNKEVINSSKHFPTLGTKLAKEKVEYEVFTLGVTSYEETKHKENLEKRKKLRNTSLCRNIEAGTECKFKFCNYAHSIKELNPTKCQWGLRCRKGEKCFYIHVSCETKESYVERLGLSKYVGVNTRMKKEVKNTRLCNSIINNWKFCREDCNYAHSIIELKPIECIFKEDCKFKSDKCKYIHSKESVENYCERLGLSKYKDRVIEKVKNSK